MLNILLGCVLIVVWAATDNAFWLTLAWFNLAVGASLHIADAIRSRR